MWHGGQTEAAAQLYPAAPGPWLDLSTGISPWAWPVPAIEPQQWQALPSRTALEHLELAAATAFGMNNPEQIAAVPGSDIAIRLLARLLPAERVAVIGQSYAGYRAAWPEARVLPFDKARGAELMICANPNNPDGWIIEARKLQRLRNIRIVDEAFADAMPEVSMLPQRNGAIVLRSFGKFFGLAGIRLGFVVANKPLIRELRNLLGDWPISGPAIAIGTAAYCDRTWQSTQRLRLTKGSAQLTALLRSQGLQDAGGTANFRLCHAPDAPGLFTHLCRAGILVRPFIDRPGQLRLGIPGTETDWARLETALLAWSKRND
ncbi:threonine-phosphate decarboxylase [Novosphingobium sp. Chol11]|uniref:threonine-phosphate decarboxylase n=1 Tax=Novosphingobium sp. Chol11 TaxID=1385763 RepID=UPI0025FBD91B|nr:threonine-phosphate decarboxylase [Novosphingobium sp. Chol11]